MKYMLTMHEESITFEWKKYQGYTVRPLPSALVYYGEIIASLPSEKKSMIYGATPEIRTIFQKLKREVTLVDRSKKMVSAMGQLTMAKTPLSVMERFINLDWLKLDEIDEKYDLLVGDDAINMVSWHHFELFLQQAWKQLNSKGLFICHLLVKPDDHLINKKLYEIKNEFKQGKIKSKYDLASRLNFICWDNKTYMMGWQKTIEEIGNEKLDQFKPEFDFIGTFGLCNSQFYCPPLCFFDKLVEKYFLISEIFYSHEHDYCLYEPIYVLEKKDICHG